jgi:hypothetical protein
LLGRCLAAGPAAAKHAAYSNVSTVQFMKKGMAGNITVKHVVASQGSPTGQQSVPVPNMLLLRQQHTSYPCSAQVWCCPHLPPSCATCHMRLLPHLVIVLRCAQALLQGANSLRAGCSYCCCCIRLGGWRGYRCKWVVGTDGEVGLQQRYADYQVQKHLSADSLWLQCHLLVTAGGVTTAASYGNT